MALFADVPSSKSPSSVHSNHISDPNLELTGSIKDNSDTGIRKFLYTFLLRKQQQKGVGKEVIWGWDVIDLNIKQTCIPWVLVLLYKNFAAPCQHMAKLWFSEFFTYNSLIGMNSLLRCSICFLNQQLEFTHRDYCLILYTFEKDKVLVRN